MSKKYDFLEPNEALPVAKKYKKRTVWLTYRKQL